MMSCNRASSASARSLTAFSRTISARAAFLEARDAARAKGTGPDMLDVVARARELGIATPFNDAIVEIDRMINKGQIKMGPENFKLLQEKVGMKPQA